MPAVEKILSCGTQPLAGGEKPSDVVTETNTTSKNPDHRQEHEDKNDVASKLSHKRTFSETNVPDQHVAESPSVLPSKKKAKSDAPDTLSAPDSENELESSSSDLDGDDLVPLTPHGPNVFYGWTDTLTRLFDIGHGDGYGLWPKSKIMHAYHSLDKDGDVEYESDAESDSDSDENKDIDVACVSICCDPEDLEPPEAKVLQSYFKAFKDSWLEVTVTRHLPAEAPMRLRVELEAGYFGVRTGVVGKKNLGKWWITDISVAEGESEEAISTVLSEMFDK